MTGETNVCLHVMVETVMTSIKTDEADLLDRKDIRVGMMVGAAGGGPGGCNIIRSSMLSSCHESVPCA